MNQCLTKEKLLIGNTLVCNFVICSGTFKSNNYIFYLLDEEDQRNLVESETEVRAPSVKISKWSCFLDSDSDVE